ncbi:hypothetical protein [Pseudobacter ginsenosidimutans]|uniref:Uncharacterized protein n=1 Tax=Pseudobacter ginsenosidimutans TaxID=661488 RepID=A0A4Q7N3R9_9BACT|nr:hypothetical protein [Pseudobacter ginsenosidimutans]QEC44170.1 hypothetical protein FSB84_21740 [Pseudobacter ginsenosidimutans]RZS75622.1 hypothetical protein EV199_1492 [Pseudobacter ginsenosidimutans]
MEHVTMNKAESLTEGFLKFFETIRITARHPRKLFAMIKKNDFSKIYKPLPVYIFTVFLFFLVTQLIPLTSTYAPYYAPWVKGEQTHLTETISLNMLIFVMINLIVGLVQISITAAIFSRRHFQTLVKLFLYAGMVVTLFKMLYVVVFPLLVAWINPNARESGIFIHPYWLMAFDIIFYFVLAFYVYLLPQKVKERDNNLHSQLLQISPNKVPGRSQKWIYGVSLWFILCLSNYSHDRLNSFTYGYLNKFGDTPGVDMTDKNEASRKALFLSASYNPNDSVDIQGMIMIKLESPGYIPSNSNRKLYFEIEETRERRWVITCPYLDMDFQVHPAENGTIEFNSGKLYPVTLKARMSSEQFGRFRKRFDKKMAHIGFQLYLNETRHCNRRYSRQIIIDIDSTHLNTSFATMRKNITQSRGKY